MYQLRATVVKVAENKDDPPIIAQLGPDMDIIKLGLPHTLHIGPGQVPHMFLLLQGGHYDLAVPRDSIRDKYTSQPEGIVNENDDGYMAEKEEDDPENEPPKTMEEKLTNMEEKYNKLKHEYVKSQHEIKSLKAYIRKIEDNPEVNGDTDGSDVEYLTNYKSKGFRKTSPQTQAETNLRCQVCKITFTNTSNLRKHMKSHNKDGDWTCDKCSFQTINEELLKEHEKNAHHFKQAPTTSNGPRKTFEGARKEEDHMESAMEPKGKNFCTSCQKDFIYRIDLKKHIINTHKTYKPCRNLENCTFSPCRYNHKEYPKGHQVCFECGEDFKTIHDMMRHRKITHKIVLCKMFLKKACDFSSEDCYFTHAAKSLETPVKIVENKTNQAKEHIQGFWETQSNLAPPSKVPSNLPVPSQSEWIQMKNTLMHLNQMMARFQ